MAGLDGERIRAGVVDMRPTTGSRPVVFLHGLVGLNEHWEDVVARVREGLRCVMLELPLLELRGEDCSIDGVTRLTTQFVERYLKAEIARGQRPVLVGNSFGGHVALRLSLARPDLVAGLILAGSSGLIERSMVREITVRPTREWLRRKIGELFFDQANMREADLDRAHAVLSQRAGARAMVKLSRSARRNHLGERMGGVRAPTLLIWGRNDVVTPPEACEEFNRLIPNSRVVWFDRCGHAPMIEKPEEFARALVEFVDGLGRHDAER